MSGGISWNDPRVSIHWWVTDAILSPWDVRLAPLAQAENSSEYAARRPRKIHPNPIPHLKTNVVETLTFAEFDLANDTVEIVDNQITDVVNSRSTNQAVAYQNILL
jgi:hypothetical protein